MTWKVDVEVLYMIHTILYIWYLIKQNVCHIENAALCSLVLWTISPDSFNNYLVECWVISFPVFVSLGGNSEQYEADKSNGIVK